MSYLVQRYASTSIHISHTIDEPSFLVTHRLSYNSYSILDS